MTVAEQYPAHEGPPGTFWYKPHPRKLVSRDGAFTDNGTGWTSHPGYADKSYGVGDGEGNAY